MLYLPFSNKRYYLSNDLLYSTNGDALNLVDGCVEIAWVDGFKKYPFELLVYFCKKKPIDPDLIMSVVVVFLDGDRSNLEKSNLSYRFNSPIEVDGHSGFFRVPGYNNYAISVDGRLINTDTGKEKVWSVTKPNKLRNSLGGYRYAGVNTDEGNYTNLFRHRAMIYTFTQIPDGVGDMVVNHKDGIPGNDELSNLELTTYAENNQHAYDNGLRTTASKALLVKNLATDEIVRYPTIKLAANACGYNTGTFIYYRMRDNPNGVYSDNLMFKFDDGTEWPEPDYSRVLLANNNREVTLFDVLKKELRIFPSCASAGWFLGVDGDTIGRYARKKVNKILKGHYVRFNEDIRDIPVLSDKVLNILSKNGCRDGYMIEVVSEGLVIYEGLLSDYLQTSPFTESRLRAAIQNGTALEGMFINRIT